MLFLAFAVSVLWMHNLCFRLHELFFLVWGDIFNMLPDSCRRTLFAYELSNPAYAARNGSFVITAAVVSSPSDIGINDSVESKTMLHDCRSQSKQSSKS